MVAIGHQAALAVEDTAYYSAMLQAERLAAMGQTIAGLSHHVKNILQGIRGGSFLIEEGLKAHDWEVTRKGWNIVEKNQERISNLVMDMLTFSKERQPEMVPSDLNRIVGEVLELMQVRASELGVEIVDGRQADIPRMTFDPEALHRAILNVVTNALDACAASAEAATEDPEHVEPADPAATQLIRPARVEVSTEYDSGLGRLRVKVRDNGIGIPPEQLKRVFNAFVSHKGQRGTGLGLPVSQKILQEHGGDILVESEPGEGSCFTLQWPAMPADATGSLAR
jgi:signal transduction histidine kinase